ncbi:hypothetical protein SDC9_132992 [bioreactor metagenome]|uniref:Uncharacterized protein n=1 Tax=bioreactor metagenome TaxID=1076179 RepID=A0A645D9Q4_9ZZZZ
MLIEISVGLGAGVSVSPCMTVCVNDTVFSGERSLAGHVGVFWAEKKVSVQADSKKITSPKEENQILCFIVSPFRVFEYT